MLLTDRALSSPALPLYMVSGTLIFVLVVLVVVLIQQRRQRLNWYEQNLLEISRAPPLYVSSKAFRHQTSEDVELGIPRAPPAASATLTPKREFIMTRKQSRIQRVRQQATQVVPAGVPDFTVPRMSKNTQSMFRNPDQSQIDRGLYQTTMDAESEYDNESCGSGGSIKVALHFDSNLNILTVELKQAVDLVAKRQDGAPNPYFKVTLDVPESTTPKSQQQTKVYKNTSSPAIEEAFYFQVQSNNIAQCRLEIMVYDYDQFSVDECIGYCWLTLGRVSVSKIKEQPTVFFAEVLPFDDDSGHGFGEILLSLSYLSKAQRLTVNVFKARNLRTDCVDNVPNISIRIALMVNNVRRLKRKKTTVKKNTANPQFNESLTFDIPKHSLCESALEIEVIHEYGTFGMGTRSLGRMELPLHKCRDLWRSIIHEEKSQARWHSLDEP